MVSYEHKIKNIYLGDNSWSPNEDTIAYFPFKEDFDDKVGNRTLTVNGCTISGGYNNINSQSSYMKLSSTIGGSILTGSVWYYYGANSTGGGRNTLFAREGGTYHHVLFPATSNSGTVGNIGFYSSGFYPSSRTLTSGKWYHIVFVKNGTNEKIYVNAELVQDSNSSFDNNSYPLGMISNLNASNGNQGAQGKMSELIFESKERTQQEITKYFKKTRTDYGYSNKDYQEVEYIESSGTQWIDTGIKASNTISTELVMAPNMSYTSEYAIFGDGRTASALFLMEYQGKYRLHNGGVYGDIANVTNEQTTITTNSTGITINGVSYSLSAGSSYTNNNIRLFATGDGSNTNKRGYFKVYSFKIYSNNDLVRDFVPCYRTADDAIGLYDKVNKVFYINSGTGTFTKGPDV